MKTPRDSSSPNPQESKRESEPGQSSSAGPTPLPRDRFQWEHLLALTLRNANGSIWIAKGILLDMYLELCDHPEHYAE